MKPVTLQSTNHDIIALSRLLSFILDLKDPYTADHSKVVRTVSVYLGRKLGFSDNALINLNIGGYMHDIGKINIPDGILFKPGRLTEEEFDIIKTHTTFGAQFIEKFSALHRYRELVLYHHEKYNGAGYPEGLAGTDIPLEARLISVADVYHALYSKRCYKPAFSKQEIMDEFKRCRGVQFDPYLTDELLSTVDSGEIETLLQDGIMLEEFEGALQSQLNGVSFDVCRPEEQLLQMIDVLSTALGIMNPPYASHCRNVTNTVRCLVDKMGLPEELAADINLAALLHDIGRMGQRPEEVKADHSGEGHAFIGAKMLKNIAYFNNILPMVAHHHEKWDGGGKPDALRGEAIPFGARVIAVADYFDASIKRPDAVLGRPLTKKEARAKIQSYGGKALDPDIVQVFAQCPQLFED